MVADFLPTPPDDLPPGAVGALIDEIAHERDIVATLVDLGRRGILKIDEQPKADSARPFGARDFSITLVSPDAEITPFEKTLVKSLFSMNGTQEESIRLSAARARFAGSADSIKEQMYAELVKRGYFVQSPEGTRQHWRRGALVALVAVVLFACIGGGILDNISAFIYFPIVVLGMFALVLVWMSPCFQRRP